VPTVFCVSTAASEVIKEMLISNFKSKSGAEDNESSSSSPQTSSSSSSSSSFSAENS
jgi:hypothetical protein